MPQSVTVRMQGTRQEIVRAFWTYLPALVAFRRRAWVIFLIGSAVMIVIGLVGSSGVFWALGIPAVGLSVLATMWFQRRQLGRAADNGGYTRPMTLTATENGLRVENASDHFFRWSNYERLVDTGDGFVLVSSGGATVRWVPFRSFESEKDKTQFRAWAEAGLAT